MHLCRRLRIKPGLGRPRKSCGRMVVGGGVVVVIVIIIVVVGDSDDDSDAGGCLLRS